MTIKNDKRKKAITAGVAAAAILLAGTFAWTSISQTAKNEAVVDINPGARLHDDFDGKNKDVYVENFGDEETGVDIYARIRLDEYMEIGQDAGTNKDDADRKALPVVEGTDINDKDTWNTFLYGEERAYAKYWGWDMGNAESHKPYYMPTFNKNKDSLVPDINGTYEGLNAGDIVHYDDYEPYDGSSSITADAVYDWDLNTIDEVEEGNASETTDESTPIDTVNILKKRETHNAQQITSGATVMSMEEWKALPEDQQAGPYWVFDTDGWAYWAQPIKPGETTGLLLDGIHMTRVPDDNWYYGINVIGQFVTASDLSAFEEDGVSDDALDLLSAAAELEAELSVEGDSFVTPGASATYTALLKKVGVTTEEQPEITWSLGADVEGISINENTGEVTVADSVPLGTSFQVVATAGLVEGTKTVVVQEPFDGQDILLQPGGDAYYPVEPGQPAVYKIRLDTSDMEGDTGDGTFYVHYALLNDWDTEYTDYTFDRDTGVLTLNNVTEPVNFNFQFTEDGSAFECTFVPVAELDAVYMSDVNGVMITLPQELPAYYRLNFVMEDENGNMVSYDAPKMQLAGAYNSGVEYNSEEKLLFLSPYFDVRQLVAFQSVEGEPNLVGAASTGDDPVIDNINLKDLTVDDDGVYHGSIKGGVNVILSPMDIGSGVTAELAEGQNLGDGVAVSSTTYNAPSGQVVSETLIWMPEYYWAEDDDYVLDLVVTVYDEAGNVIKVMNVALEYVDHA